MNQRLIELYQAEWCPHSHRVRQRLTELGLEYVARQVPVERAERRQLERATGCQGIPTLVFEDGAVAHGEDEILAALDLRVPEPREAVVHRAKAREEWPEWLRLEGNAMQRYDP